MPRKRLLFAGIIGRYPVGGVTWCALHYLAGFRALGYEVHYLEDTGECGFDPLTNSITKDPAYALSYIRKHLELVGMADAWTYVDFRGRYHGRSRTEVAEFCAGAELMVNLSGGYWPRGEAGAPDAERPFHREYEPLHKIFIDTDPGFTQLAIQRAGPGWYRDFFAAHDKLFTFALNIESPDCRVAETPFRWHPTVQPVALDFWPVVPPPPDAPWSAIMSWRTDSFRGMGEDKAIHLHRLIDLPTKVPFPILLAIAGRYPGAWLARHRWEVTGAVAATIDAFAYRSFIQRSRAELGFAKPLYVETRSGWFSDRTLCYLASGRPALVGNTGLAGRIPLGEGLLVFDDVEGVLAGIAEIEADYGRHSRRAREIAADCFDAATVVPALLRTAGAS